MPALNERATEALTADESAGLQAQLQGIRKPATEAATQAATLSVEGQKVELPATATDAVFDLLQRLADGHAIVVASTDALLTTSQAAELIGISATYLLRLANTGVIAVEYRGTHRRFKLADALAYLEESKRTKVAKAAVVASATQNTAPGSTTR